ncbi:MAG: ParB/RepB/Spo0J family partition protein [Sedimentisphaerales bacterium]|nr:ParB/RepB/Spo0J family partition protein [Sedimentisphaerales bacterium]
MTEKTEKPKHLGRGLASLLGPITTITGKTHLPVPLMEIGSNALPVKDLGDTLKELNISDIQPNPFQVRFIWNEQELSDLANSIKANGVIQPIIVRRSGTGYQLIAGERRWRAARIAGITTVPAIIRQVTDDNMIELALVENIHRTDLNPIERATAYQKYLTSLSLTQAEASSRLGEDRSVIANFLRLLDLPAEIRQMLIDSQLTMGHARAILALPTDEVRRKLANRAMAGRLSVREVERLVRIFLSDRDKQKITVKTRPAHIQDLENRLSKDLGTNVAIETRKNGKCGRIVIEFHSLEEFDRIMERIGVTSTDEV